MLFNKDPVVLDWWTNGIVIALGNGCDELVVVGEEGKGEVVAMGGEGCCTGPGDDCLHHGGG